MGLYYGRRTKLPTRACQCCGQRFRPERANARYCGGSCKQRAAYQRGLSAALQHEPDARECGNTGTRMNAGEAARIDGEPFTLEGDTIEGRKWRVSDGWFECEAMVTGGWKKVFEVADISALNAALAWLAGARPVAVAEWEAA
jgi:hypothetical protein